MRVRRAWAGFLFLLMPFSLVCAQTTRPSVDSDECGPELSSSGIVQKTPVFTNPPRTLRAYGEIVLRRDIKSSACPVVYRLWIAQKYAHFSLAKHLELRLSSGQIAGIEIIGLSPKAKKLVADFLWAEGDGTIHHPVVFDEISGAVADKALDDRIQKRIHGCDQPEDFIGVTDAGEAVFAIPPSIYDDSPECGDKGVWRFNLKTGRVYRVAKFSGEKWQ